MLSRIARMLMKNIQINAEELSRFCRKIGEPSVTANMGE
jgi:hypothetical protein